MNEEEMQGAAPTAAGDPLVDAHVRAVVATGTHDALLRALESAAADRIAGKFAHEGHVRISAAAQAREASILAAQAQAAASAGPLMPDGKPEIVEQPNTMPVHCTRCGRFVPPGKAISRGEWDPDTGKLRKNPRREWTQRCADAETCTTHSQAKAKRERERLEGVVLRRG